MAFKSSHAYSQFAQSVRWEWRYRLDAEQHEFLDELLATAGSRTDSIPSGYILYRAQEGCDWPETPEEEEVNPGPSGYGPARMKPLLRRAADGRVNPRGIPCLYTATNEVTAAAETRAWMGAYVSIAQLKTNRELRIINCTSDYKPNLTLFREPDPATWNDRVWSAVDRAFAAPVERSDHVAEYAATQIIAETFRRANYHGIAYRSSLSDGYNIALFDVSAADVINCSVYEVQGLAYKIDEVANRYFVTAHYPNLKSQDSAQTEGDTSTSARDEV